jgi:nucleoid-associated protein YgaU
MSNLSVLAFDETPRGNGICRATEEIAQLLDHSEIDAPSALYDEALTLAKQGRFAPSTDRLRMLLTLDPIDADASLLLGKVLAARGQWQEALQRLDAAQANGTEVPMALRDKVELALRNQIEESEAHRLRVTARERGEIRNLRAEAKRLRSDNAVLDQQIHGLYRRVRLWSSATALVSGCAAALLLVALISGGTEAIAETHDLAVTTPEAVDDARAVYSATSYNYPLPEVTPTTSTSAITAENPMATHTVKSGDTLGRIAQEYYGKSSEWRIIRDANTDQLSGGIRLNLGMKLNIPSI